MYDLCLTCALNVMYTEPEACWGKVSVLWYGWNLCAAGQEFATYGVTYEDI